MKKKQLYNIKSNRFKFQKVIRRNDNVLINLVELYYADIKPQTYILWNKPAYIMVKQQIR